MKSLKRSTLHFLIGIIFVTALAGMANAAVYTVTMTNEDNDGICNSRCTLREAIQAAGPSDEVVFSDIFKTPQIIYLTNGHITTNGITITGPGSNLLTVRSVIGQGPTSRIFNFNGSINLSGMTISGGNVNGAGGGGIAVGGGTATLNDVVITDNSASGGVTAYSGGITVSGAVLIMNNCAVTNNTASSPFEDTGAGIRVASGELYLNNTTVSGNRSLLGNYNGGGVYVRGPATITNSTITDNETAGAIGASGLYNAGFDNIVLNNSIVAGNRGNNVREDVEGQFSTASSYNLIGNVGIATGLLAGNNNQIGNSSALIDPQLYALGNYGGKSPTHALRATSTAINPVGATSALTTDQRGAPRQYGASVDIGAFEFMPMVTNLSDSGGGSLRQVLDDINTAGSGVVMFEPGFFAATSRQINVNGVLMIPPETFIAGTGANYLRINNVAAQGPSSRVMQATGGNITLSGLTISGGNDTSVGGGILSLANLTIRDCHITGNTSQGLGGGITSFGTLNVFNSTISGNSATGGGIRGGGISIVSGATYIISSTISGNSALGGIQNGGGIWNGQSNSAPSNLIILNSTIANNAANGSQSASGIYFDGGTGSVTLGNTIVAANVNNSSIPDLSGPFVSNGWNLVGNIGSSSGIGVAGDQFGTGGAPPRPDGKSLAPTAVLDPGLYSLDMNGGPVPTHGLRASSSAMDMGNCFGCSLDQRGLAKPVDLPATNYPGLFGGADIGAFEAQTVPTSAGVFVGGRVLTADGRAIGSATVVLIDQTGTSRQAITNPLGYFTFENVASGASYVIDASQKRYRFTPQVMTINGELADVSIVANN